MHLRWKWSEEIVSPLHEICHDALATDFVNFANITILECSKPVAFVSIVIKETIVLEPFFTVSRIIECRQGFKLRGKWEG